MHFRARRYHMVIVGMLLGSNARCGHWEFGCRCGDAPNGPALSPRSELRRGLVGIAEYYSYTPVQTARRSWSWKDGRDGFRDQDSARSHDHRQSDSPSENTGLSRQATGLSRARKSSTDAVGRHNRLFIDMILVRPHHSFLWMLGLALSSEFMLVCPSDRGHARRDVASTLEVLPGWVGGTKRDCARQ